MKSIALYVYILLIIFINLVLIKYVDLELVNLVLIISLFNVMTFPILYLFIAIETTVSIPNVKYHNFDINNANSNRLTIKILNEFIYLLKQPATLFLVLFPFIFLWNNKVNFTVFYFINIIFIFFLLFNLIIISTLIKHFYKNLFSVFITVLGILFSVITTLNFTNQNIFNITLFLVSVSFLSILFLIYLKKKNFILHN
jgi:hypothetical protein